MLDMPSEALYCTAEACNCGAYLSVMSHWAGCMASAMPDLRLPLPAAEHHCPSWWTFCVNICGWASSVLHRLRCCLWFCRKPTLKGIWASLFEMPPAVTDYWGPRGPSCLSKKWISKDARYLNSCKLCSHQITGSNQIILLGGKGTWVWMSCNMISQPRSHGCEFNQLATHCYTQYIILYLCCFTLC